MTTRIVAAALATFFCAARAGAQEYVEILSANVGLPPGRFTDNEKRDDNGQASHVSKNGTWAPVYTRLKLVREVKQKLAIVVESKDSDNLGTSFAVPLPDLSQVPPGTVLEPAEIPLVPYVRPTGQEIEVSVRIIDGGDPSYWRLRGQPFRIKYPNSRDISRFVVLSLGSKLPGFDLPQSEQANVTLTGDGRTLRGGRVETAAISDVALMPDQWFGYGAADVVVLTTGAVDANFLNALFADPNRKPKLDALREWVRRGGKLVVSVGANAGLAAQFDQLREFLPMEVNKSDPAGRVTEVGLDWYTTAPGSSSGFRSFTGTLQPRNGTFPLANLVAKADRPSRTLAPSSGDGKESRLKAVVQSAYGLGRVTLVAFDLDGSPFTEYSDRAKFWDLLLKETTAPHAPTKAANKNRNDYSYRGFSNDTEDELATGLRNHVDNFEGVPVISFGWVAAFILLYTLLIGPVEYFVLKKVFKRLELTWVTFPVIVLTVSAVAYFTAYSLKGDDLKVNKVDVVDVDPASGRVFGRTWFTVFSPRIDNYTVGLTPADGWNSGTDSSPATLDWFGGAQQGKQGSFFSRKYYYRTEGEAEADGLVNVPIQVWSTKAFTGEWSARTPKDAPVVVSNLSHPPADRTKVTGSFTLNLPVSELKDVRLIYAGRAYKYEGAISPGTTVNVFLDDSKRDADWVSGFASIGGFEVKAQQKAGAPPVTFSTFALAPLLFAEAGTRGEEGPATQNASLRRLDQSWRLSPDNRDEVLLVGRTTPTVDDAEKAMSETNGVSPTKLWLKGLPGSGSVRTPVPGTLRQETYVRVYVPVKPAGK